MYGLNIQIKVIIFIFLDTSPLQTARLTIYIKQDLCGLDCYRCFSGDVLFGVSGRLPLFEFTSFY